MVYVCAKFHNFSALRGRDQRGGGEGGNPPPPPPGCEMGSKDPAFLWLRTLEAFGGFMLSCAIWALFLSILIQSGNSRSNFRGGGHLLRPTLNPPLCHTRSYKFTLIVSEVIVTIITIHRTLFVPLLKIVHKNISSDRLKYKILLGYIHVYIHNANSRNRIKKSSVK